MYSLDCPMRNGLNVPYADPYLVKQDNRENILIKIPIKYLLRTPPEYSAI